MHKIRDVIADREPVWVRADQTVKEVVDCLCEHHIGAVAVKEGDEVVGVFSERDLMHRVVHKGLDPKTVAVKDVMSKGRTRVSPEDDHRVAKMHMYEHRVRHLVVEDEFGEFMGLVSMRDLVDMDVEEYADLVAKLNDRYYQLASGKEGGQ